MCGLALQLYKLDVQYSCVWFTWLRSFSASELKNLKKLSNKMSNHNFTTYSVVCSLGENCRSGGKPEGFHTSVPRCKWSHQRGALWLSISPSGPPWRRRTRPTHLSVLSTDRWLIASNYLERYLVWNDEKMFKFPPPHCWNRCTIQFTRIHAVDTCFYGGSMHGQ